MAGRKDDNFADRPYDEAIPIETDDEDVSTPASSERSSPRGDPGGDDFQPRSGNVDKASPNAASASGSVGNTRQSGEDSDSESSSSSGSSESESGSGAGGESGEKKGKPSGPAGAYDPNEYKNMKVSDEIRELFGFIDRYTPHTIDLDSQLRPFIPELIPSIGEVDAFLKMPRPDEGHRDVDLGTATGASNLGTTRLDEPTLNPSDPSILDLQLRSICKHQDIQPMEVRSIEHAEKNTKEIENWVKRIDELNRAKPAPTVQYSKRMPDIEQLMQVWASEFEEHLQQEPLPNLSDLDLDLPSLIKIMASILDVPVHGHLTETLHVIFTLYSEFKTNQHFSKTDTLAGHQDAYSFPTVQAFGASGPIGVGATGPVFGNQMESMAPSRAPSPAKGGHN